MVIRVLVLALLLASPCAAQTCPPPGVFVPERKVSLSTGMGVPVYSSELSRAQVNALAGRLGQLSGGKVVGLTQSEVEGKVLPQFWTVDLGGGQSCLGLGRVDGFWRLRDLIVHIASEYGPGGCNYAKVRLHEDEHVAIARETFQRWAPRLEDALRREAGGISPMVVPLGQVERRREEITQRLFRSLNPPMDGFRAELRDRNAAIDTAANYRLVMSRCPSW
ncbi:hypothetical protein A6A04_09265 [Paramagnetospirillum marisnigri]|uniref:DUF922 domain-containing protein n=1 Tax=Paramagnetospirillum marisnigri TaxID=1285242 RepID=A0A178M6A2_9PROT|nr:hypothetical protein [Paramagnetospirillum marisnigri]OAN44056.1 hypothetical protein A6A04_09265 [Paramagnetospirillum marisnigri]